MSLSEGGRPPRPRVDLPLHFLPPKSYWRARQIRPTATALFLPEREKRIELRVGVAFIRPLSSQSEGVTRPSCVGLRARRCVDEEEGASRRADVLGNLRC